MKKTLPDPNIAFRKVPLQQAVSLMQIGECFIVSGLPSVGKSRFLRHISYQESFLADLAPTKAKVYYVDLRNSFSDDLLSSVLHTIEPENTTIDLADFVKKILETNDVLYLVLDEVQELANMNDDSILRLRALRDAFKYRLNFIFAYDKDTELPTNAKVLLDVAKYTIALGPLDDSDMLDTVKYLAEQYSYKLSSNEAAFIVEKSQGYPGKAREYLLGTIFGSNPIDEGKTSKKPIDADVLLGAAIYHLTKSEYLLLKTIVEKPNYFIDKDEIAVLMSPESDGVGVSDAAISQLVNRLRKKLNLFQPNISIKSKRGFGYILS